MGSVIVGTGVAQPPHVVSNADLVKVMDTSDEWIQSRTGVARRRYVAPGVGSVQLAAEAVSAALNDAGVAPGEVDLLVNATMTPDMFAPGNAALVQAEVGLERICAFEIRQQCSGFVYGLELADAMLANGRATTAVVVGAEAHAGYMPFGPTSWAMLRGTHDGPADPDEYAAATDSRAWSVLFGDGAGACVLRRGEDDSGFIGGRLFSDGGSYDLIHVPGIGFSRQPYIDAAQLEAGLCIPQMKGMELFRQAVRAMPSAVTGVLDSVGLSVSDLDLVIAHQANARIVSAVGTALGLDESVVPSNIAEHGNTTAATLPILFHEQRLAGRVGSGALVAFTAFGAGAHWGASLYRVP
ncbi:MAG: 3-oxoacyl-ACP synthase [Actinobacteria bacterium]|nr:3-oxoacyl-ACP synthase [Actinomycetota bacterium]